MKQLIVNSADHGGLSFAGHPHTAREIAAILRAAIDATDSTPNYLSDFVFALEVECQEAGVLDADFNPING